MSRSTLPAAVSVADLIARFGGDARGARTEVSICRLASLSSAGVGDLSFLSGARHRAQAASTRATAVVVSEGLLDALPASAAAIVVNDPYAHFARIARWVDAQHCAQGVPEIDATARIAGSAKIGAQVSIGAFVTIEADAIVGDGSIIGANTHIGRNARIGAACIVHPRVTILDDCMLGTHCIVHSGTVIGSDGFGFANEGGRWEKIPQLGAVVIGNDVEIGSNCSIDRGALDDTLIGDGCKLDNLIQVAHNVRIGEHTAIAGCVGIAGSATIGRRCMIGGGAGILGHLEICDDVVVSAMSLVTRSIAKPGFYSGVFPLMPNDGWEKAAATVRQLPGLRERIRSLERARKTPDQEQSKSEE
jgi:UDP-3-O-[3-hydroxymyristoyl] glucosamine N-acyltransferase